MSELIHTAEIICPGCGATASAGAERCLKCGVMLVSTAGSPVAVQPSPPSLPLHERRWAVIVLLVFAALFLGFPFLWKSRAFSPTEKIFWTILVLIETVLVFWLFYIAMAWAIGGILDVLK